jgi:ATP-dependent Clp protease protease subunit
MNTVILEEIENGELIPIDVYTKLSGSRILFLTEDIDDKLASDVVATLFLKDIEDPGEKITLFINSEGGDIRNVLMIYDMINIIQSPVETVCIGSCLDEVSIILASGAKRLATKNAIIAINQLSFEFSTISDLTEAETILNQKVADNKTMINILSKKTGKTVAQITKDFSHQVFFTAESALKYGLIDGIISTGKK